LFRSLTSMLPLMLYWASTAKAKDALPTCTFPDEPAMYVLTVQPEPNSVIYLFGHTALLDWNPKMGPQSRVYDYGLFQLPDSILETVVNYLTMKQEYFLGISTWRRNEALYHHAERGVVAQRLALDPAEMHRLRTHIARDAADPTFHYNWYDQNCSTKVRDGIDVAMRGALEEQMQGSSGTSPAGEVLRHSALHPLWLGLQWGSTRLSRQEINDYDAMFLPEPMMHRLAKSTRKDGAPLVGETCQAVPDGKPPIQATPPSRAGLLGLLGLAMAGALVGLTRWSRTAGLVTVGLVSATGTVWGIAALIVGFAGTFAPFWGHDNQLFTSPLWALATVGAVLAWRSPGSELAARLALVPLGLAGLGFVVSLAQGFSPGNLGFALFFVPLTGAMAWVIRSGVPQTEGPA